MAAATEVYICDLCGREFTEAALHWLCPKCEMDAERYAAQHPE